jgi:formylglycine-generating enzyme required for sulfatase activity
MLRILNKYMKTYETSGIVRAMIRGLLGLPLLALPLVAQNVSRLTLEESSNLQNWQKVPVTPAMLDANGEILVPTNTAQKFYRMKSDLLIVPVDMVLIPAGAFTMGRTSGDTDSDAPPISVTVSAFYMGKYEVTKALWDEVRTYGAANGYTDLRVGGGKSGNHPVHTISWFDMVKWCNARSQKDGLTPVYTLNGEVMKTGIAVATANWGANGYRLPTEAEWEKAARGGVSGKRFSSGTDTISHSQANYYATSSYSYDSSGSVNNFHPTYATDSPPYSSPVGIFAPNGYGLYDMTGNMWECCWDWYGASMYVSGATDPRGATTGTSRVTRGGSWNDGALGCRAAVRNPTPPIIAVGTFGFRIARNPVPQ